MKRVLLLLFICFLFTPFTAIQSYAEEQEQKKENILLQEGFNVPASKSIAYPIQKGNGTIVQEKTEPFYKLYENVKFDVIVFEGTIRSVSSIPDPAHNDYPDCLYSLMVDVNSVLSKNEQNETMAQSIIINLPILKNNVIIKEHVLEKGQKIKVECVPYDLMPDAVKEIQLADDYQSFEHEYFYVLKINSIEAFSNEGANSFKKRVMTFPKVVALPKDESASQARRNRIQHEIKRVEEELTKHGGSFKAWKEEYRATIAVKYKALCTEQYKGWVKDSYFAANGVETSYKTKAYIEGIMPYKQYLEKLNIDLIIIRMPTMWDFAARVLASEEFQENPWWLENYYECLKNDIEIIDPMREMWEHRFEFPLFYYYNNTTEGHPAEGAHYFAAKCISNILKRYDTSSQETHHFTLCKTIEKKKSPSFVYPPGNDKFKGDFNFNMVLRDQKDFELGQDTGAPFLFVSNSFGGHVPIQSVSTPKFSSYFLQKDVDWMYRPSKHLSVLRIMLSSQNLLSGRKAVITLGMPGMWDAFSPLPRYITDNATTLQLEKTLSLDSDELSILNKDAFIYKKQKDGSTTINLDKEQSFNLQMSIPAIPDKKICMVRVIFSQASCFYLTLIDSDTKKIIEKGIQPNSEICDLFIDAEKSRNITIMFTYRGSSKTFSFDKIELWYY